jgi:indole-3-glycerol phosphate synthase
MSAARTSGASTLEGIVQATRSELAGRMERRSLAQLEAELEQARGRAQGSPRAGAGRFRAALARPGMAAIAEFKRRSPSAGLLRDGAQPVAAVGEYVRGGARAASVLTEGPHFGGSLADLREVRGAYPELPLLRKDFILERYQLVEAALAGADAVLLIVAALAQSALTSLREGAAELGLDALVEVHDREELRRAAAAGADLIGVNNRDLRDFTVDVERTFALLPHMPAGAVVVSESGIADPSQVERLRGAGVDAVLVGEALMRDPDPAARLALLLGSPDRV